MTIIDRLLSLFVVPDCERLRNLLVPELADLRQQLDQARRLAGEAQGRFRAAEQRANDYDGRLEVVKMDLARAAREAVRAEIEPLTMERDQLREQLTLEVKNAMRLAAEGDQLRGRVAELEAERAKMIENGPMAEPRPNLTTEGAPIPRAVWDALVEYTKRTP